MVHKTKLVAVTGLSVVVIFCINNVEKVLVGTTRDPKTDAKEDNSDETTFSLSSCSCKRTIVNNKINNNGNISYLSLIHI